jgi:hypothetical protein
MTKEQTKLAIEALVASRRELAAHGWNVSRATIGHYNGQIRICDDNGAADLSRNDTHGWIVCYVGCCDMVVVHIVRDSLKFLNSTVDASR